MFYTQLKLPIILLWNFCLTGSEFKAVNLQRVLCHAREMQQAGSEASEHSRTEGLIDLGLSADETNLS